MATKKSSSAPSPTALAATSPRTRFEPTNTVTIRLTGNCSAILAEPPSFNVTRQDWCTLSVAAGTACVEGRVVAMN